MDSMMRAFDRSLLAMDRLVPGATILKAGRTISLVGVILPLLLIGLLKFTDIEIDALKPLIANTPWLVWLYPVFGEAGASFFLGVVELITALLLIVSVWSPRAGVVGGLLALLTFTVTISTMLALPIWEAGSGGFPFLNGFGQFLIKDVALLGIAAIVLGDSIRRLRPGA